MSSINSQGRWEFDENGNVHYVSPEDAQNGAAGGSYHNSYRGNVGSSAGKKAASKRSKKGDDGWHWLLIVLGFMFWWPVGLVLLFMQLGGKWPGDKKVDQEFRRATAAARNAARQVREQAEKVRQQAQAAEFDGIKVEKTGQTKTAEAGGVKVEKNSADRAAQWQEAMDATRAAQQRQKARQSRKKQQKDRGAVYGLGHIGLLRGIGIGMTAVFGFAFVMTLLDEIRYFYSWNWFFGETLPLLALCLIGLTLIGVAGSRKRKLKRFEKYLSMIGGKSVVSIAALAKSMGAGERKVEKDLEEMLERDFWDSGYVDAARRALVLGELVEEPEPEPQEEAPESENEDKATATLRRIRGVNDAIANQELSDKIDRIEELTAKIFRLLEERPEKAGELRSFMNYYLPQTLKILDSYSKLEAQGIEGENIAEAKSKIEAMMDKLVDGYETQLDKLFADDVLDISADLKVMESMLEKDGLTADSELKF